MLPLNLRITAIAVTLFALGSISGVVKPNAAAAQTVPVVPGHFDQFKALEGEWVGATKETAGLRVTYHVTSGASTVVETIAPGSQHEMITVITKDRESVSLTHYCAIGNQPHMVAPDSDGGKVVAFKFQNAGNLKSENDMHMREVTYTFVDKDNLKTVWTTYNGGKPAGNQIFILKRKKPAARTAH
jgi:hypothetical protein